MVGRVEWTVGYLARLHRLRRIIHIFILPPFLPVFSLFPETGSFRTTQSASPRP